MSTYDRFEQPGGLSRTAVIAIGVVLLHVAGLWALQTGLLRRAVEVVVPVELLSEFITPPAPVWNPHPSGPSNSSATFDVSTFTTLRARVTVSAEKEDWPKKCEVTRSSPLA